jgi:hypothetical protein
VAILQECWFALSPQEGDGTLRLLLVWQDDRSRGRGLQPSHCEKEQNYSILGEDKGLDFAFRVCGY